jgi:hypothetical protein
VVGKELTVEEGKSTWRRGGPSGGRADWRADRRAADEEIRGGGGVQATLKVVATEGRRWWRRKGEGGSG